MSDMTLTRKATALNALSSLEVKVRTDGSWYASCYGIESSEGGILSGVTGNSDKGPEQAIQDLWAQMVQKRRLVKNAYGGDKRREYRWNGFMWDDITPVYTEPT